MHILAQAWMGGTKAEAGGLIAKPPHGKILINNGRDGHEA